MSQEVIDKVIPGEERITCRYADLLDNEMEKLESEMAQWKQQDEDVLSYALFDQVAVKFFEQRRAEKYKVDKDLVDMQEKTHYI